MAGGVVFLLHARSLKNVYNLRHGMYGVLSFMVNAKEMSIRMAMGALPSTVVRLSD